MHINEAINPFQTIDSRLAQTLAQRFASPVYLIAKQAIVARLAEFQALAKHYYPHTTVALSYKTNPIHGLLALLHQQGAYAEVVSGEEYRIATRLGVPGTHIIFNGPMKTEQELTEALLQGAYLHCDHLDEIDRIEVIAQRLKRQAKIGLRLCFIDEQTNWSRFGFAVSQYSALPEHAIHVVKRIQASPHLNLAGLHAHIGTNIRDLAQFAALGRNLAAFATELLLQFNLQLEWLDVGGGLAGISPRIDEQQIGPHPLPSLDQYLAALITPLLPYLTSLSKPAQLFFEPGRTLFEPFAGLLTQIIGRRRDQPELAELICDAGFNTLATSHVYNHPLHVPSPTGDKRKTILYGPTCNQADRLHVPIELPMLIPGDFVLFYGVGAYCMSFSYSFIRYRPGVILWHGDDQADWLRYPESLEHASQLERLPISA